MTILYFPLYALLWLLSRLPMGVLYAISDLFFLPVFYLIRYRRKLVQRQLADSFPKKTDAERRQIEKRFYHFLCDLVVEYIKLISITPEEMERRVQFPGLDKAAQMAEADGKSFCFFYLGHYCNWEWLASHLGLWSAMKAMNSFSLLRRVVRMWRKVSFMGTHRPPNLVRRPRMKRSMTRFLSGW